MQEKSAQAASNHLPIVTPPPVWSSPSVGGSYLPPTGQSWADPSMVDNLKRQVDLLRNQLAGASEENGKLKAEVTSLKVDLEKNTSQHSEVEATLIPSQVSSSQKHLSRLAQYFFKSLYDTILHFFSGNVKVMEDLRQQMHHFCVVVEKMK